MLVVSIFLHETIPLGLLVSNKWDMFQGRKMMASEPNTKRVYTVDDVHSFLHPCWPPAVLEDH